MLTGIVGVKDIDPNVLINHLYSLRNQTDKDFLYWVVDYGSSPLFRIRYERITASDGPFGFAGLIRVDRDTGVWNISRAFNIGIRHTITDYVFTTGADILLPPTLIAQIKELVGPKTFVRAPMIAFSVDAQLKNTGEIPYYNAVLAMPRDWLVENRGYDERYMLWGSEDEDIIIRLRMSGFSEKFADKEKLLHQAHPERRWAEQAIANRKILEESHGIIKRNQGGWGEL